MKVLSVENVKNKVRVVLGDETGKVKGFFYENEALKEGNTVVIFRAEAAVVKEHIEIQLPPRAGRVEESKSRKIQNVDEAVDRKSVV